ncbi:unnamed protein product [Didymodactylos carnosus]|uniref:Lsm14-like N-terminal domain-containing protein n=1 Tax=Didymodactylos carnosus TaxID=1234261 RepID=A0A8S2CYW0_9BILA|nr:unnamed protein product [Didymodactylos carnosus]CAF3553647.1 unnamed protein product [Didymodactylos carnosus]
MEDIIELETFLTSTINEITNDNDEEQLDPTSIAHSPYYGCTVRVISKAKLTYDGILDAISTDKDIIVLKNVKVNGLIRTSFKKNKDNDKNHIPMNNDQNKDDDINSEQLKAAMLDHLTSDFRVYDQVCLNVRDIQELKLIQMPDFHHTKQKLRSIDPCLIDIKLSSDDQSDYFSNNQSINNTTITRRSPSQPTTSTWINSHDLNDSQSINHQLPISPTNDLPSLQLSSSNESSFSQGSAVADESNDDSIDEQLNKFNKLKINSSKPVTNPISRTENSATLIAKKILSRKVEKRPDPVHSPIDTNTSAGRMLPLKYLFPDSKESVYGNLKTAPKSVNNTIKKPPLMERRKSSPIRVTITSTLNPNAPPFIVSENTNGSRKPNPNRILSQNPSYPSFTFYEKRRFRPRLQPVHSPERMPYGINPNPRFMPPTRQIVKRNFNQQLPNRMSLHNPQQVHPSSQTINRTRQNSTPDRRYYNNNTKSTTIQQQGGYSYPYPKKKAISYDSLEPSVQQQGFPEFQRQNSTSVLDNQTSVPHTSHLLFSQSNAPLIKERHSARETTAYNHSTRSLQASSSMPQTWEIHSARNHLALPQSGEFHRRGQRTISGTSSGSSLSCDIYIGPHSVSQVAYGQQRTDIITDDNNEKASDYDFEKANNEFRRYVELEQLVTRKTPEIDSDQLYKKELSFFDRISCAATTGTAVGYAEIPEDERNLETFGEDALLTAGESVWE